MTNTTLRLRAVLLCGAATTLLATGPLTTAAAQTTIETERTTPLVTSADGAVTVSAGGSVTVTGGVAITIDSDEEVAVAGDVEVEGEAPGNGGVLITGERTASYTQGGAITVGSATVPPLNGAAGALVAWRTQENR